MSKPPVEAGQLWMFLHRGGEHTIFLVLGPSDNGEPDGWDLVAVGGKWDGYSWDRGGLMLTGMNWRFLS